MTEFFFFFKSIFKKISRLRDFCNSLVLLFPPWVPTGRAEGLEHFILHKYPFPPRSPSGFATPHTGSSSSDCPWTPSRPPKAPTNYHDPLNHYSFSECHLGLQNSANSNWGLLYNTWEFYNPNGHCFWPAYSTWNILSPWSRMPGPAHQPTISWPGQSSLCLSLSPLTCPLCKDPSCSRPAATAALSLW